MKISVVKSSGSIVAACLCVASVSFGEPPTTVQLISGSGDNGGATINSSEGGIYTSPYLMSIGGTVVNHGNSVSGGTKVPLICDDFADNINVGEFWTANVTDLSQIAGPNPNNANVYYGTANHFSLNGGYTQTELYVAAAYLAVQILKAPTGSSAPELSLALWEVFQPTVVQTDALQTKWLSQANIDIVQADYTAALNLAKTGSILTSTGGTALTGAQFEADTGHDVKIYTPQIGTQVPHGDGAPQEFIGVPEPSTLAVLGFDLVGAGILGLYFRRRQSRIRS